MVWPTNPILSFLGEPPTVEASNRHDQRHGTFPVVALGASAGGLEALNAFFEVLPINSGAAFVVIQHLRHTRKASSTS
ncbi:MAG: hypothetical protein IPK19_29745 [Chloroflexi bacterium]|nr:hypothetical protein [Chloroflexota bacterium]